MPKSQLMRGKRPCRLTLSLAKLDKIYGVATFPSLPATLTRHTKPRSSIDHPYKAMFQPSRAFRVRPEKGGLQVSMTESWTSCGVLHQLTEGIFSHDSDAAFITS